MNPKSQQTLVKTLNCVAVLIVAVLLVGLYDVGHLGLGKMMSSLVIVPIVLFVICSITPMFLGGQGSDPEDVDEESLMAWINDVQSKLATRITTLQLTVDGLSGQDSNTLMEENRLLKEQIEAIHQAERDKVLSEAKQLRDKNDELEAQIKQWAMQTVGDTVGDEGGAQSRAA